MKKTDRLIVGCSIGSYVIGLVGLFLIMLIAGCAGSPRIAVTKNIYILDNESVTLHYETNSNVNSDAEIEQTLEDLVDAEVPLTP